MEPAIPNLFDAEPSDVILADGAVVLGGFARAFDDAVVTALRAVVAHAPFRNMLTPGGRKMSVAMTNCGTVGWVSDGGGYRYSTHDPVSGRSWPPLPASFRDLATRAAERAGFAAFALDACLINRYEPGTRLSLHQDKDEKDFDAPIVSVSLGLPATFLFGGAHRSDTPQRVRLVHGDVVVWGGPSRLRYHGILPLEDGDYPLLGRMRINLTFRKAM
jgi:alkylated DNA repair protein (DNA oxidative demethylase)